MKTIFKVLLDWENILTMHIPDKEPVSIIYKELSKINSKRTNNLKYRQKTNEQDLLMAISI